MPITVNVKGQTLQFPDGTPNDVIDATVKRDFFGGGAPAAPVDHAARLAALQNAQGPGSSSLDATVRDATEGMANDAVNLGVGAAKGVGNTVVGLGRLAHQIPGIPGMQQSMAQIAPDQTGAFSGQDADINSALKARGTMQNIGKGAEQAAEFFVPGMAGAKAAKGAGLLARMAVEGGNAAAVSAAQGGSPLLAGGAAAAIPVLGAAAKTAAPWMADTLLGTKAGNFSTGLDPGEAVVQEGVNGLTGNRYLQSIKTAKDSAMARLNTVLARTQGAVVDGGSIVSKPLDAAIQTATAMPEQKAILQGIKQQIEDEAAQQGWQLDRLTPQQTNMLRQRVNAIANAATGDATVPDAITQALYRVKFGLNDAIDAAAPGAKSLNRTYAGLTEAEGAYKAKLNAAKGHFWDYVAMMPAMHNVMQGEPLAAIATMLKGLAVKQALTSPATVGTAARGLYQFGRSGVNSTLAKAAAAGVSDATEPNRPDAGGNNIPQ